MSEPVRQDGHTPFQHDRSRASLAGRPIGGLLSVLGAVLSVAAVAAVTMFALVFAATLVLVFVVAGALLSLTATAWRVRRRPEPAGVLIHARKVGHRWVAYGWDDARP